MKIIVHPAATADLNHAAAFYSAQANKQLGLTLIAEFEKAVSLLSENPEFRDAALTTGIGGNNDYAYQVKQVRNVILKYKLGVDEDE